MNDWVKPFPIVDYPLELDGKISCEDSVYFNHWT